LFQIAELSIIIWNMSLPHDDGSRKPDTRIGVLDRSVRVLDAIEAGARTFTDVVEATGLTRATAHRLIRGLEEHGFLVFLGGQGYRLGPRLVRLASTAMRELPLREIAHPVLERLAQTTGESAQLFVRRGDVRVCVDAVESDNELRTIVSVGAELPLWAGSAGKVFLAWMEEPERSLLISHARRLTRDTPVGEILERDLGLVERRGWASSAGERQPAVGSVSAPIHGPYGVLVGAVSISGPVNRIGRRKTAQRWAPAVTSAAREIGDMLGGRRR
jgi:DNA-binding IclR family transcriptional regulator